MKRPLHKHIGHHVRRAHRSITKYLYERDTIFATLWVFLFIIILGSIPLNLYVNNPFKLALKDFDFNDLYYSKVKNPDKFDQRVTIINIGLLDREGLAALIDKTASYQPKVMGLDVLFNGPRDEYKDSLIRETIARNKNLIIASRMEPSAKKGVESEYVSNYFTQSTGATEAFVNFFHEENTSIRYWNAFWEDHIGHEVKHYKSFTAALIEKYDPEKFKYLEEKVHGKKYINYTRKLIPQELISRENPSGYQLIEADSIFNDAVDSAAI
jgi:hypothetical protein